MPHLLTVAPTQSAEANTLLNYLFEFLIALVAGLVASILFLYYVLIRWRPKIKISPFIAYGPTPENHGVNQYSFKFINKSRHDGYDVQIRISVLVRIPVQMGKFNERRLPLRAKLDFLSHIPRYQRDKEHVNTAPHAIIFSCLDDLAPVLEADDKVVEIQIILKHGLTGLSKVFRHEYINSGDVVNGHFKYGNNLTVVK
ncbi:MAG TPA: hypothetical protein VG738_10955 [Chitinophagaceae bacterium]|nr:hypothetical protein [Chitinophagaceae bacterium]